MKMLTTEHPVPAIPPRQETLTAEQQIRIRSLELTLQFYEKTSVNGGKPIPSWILDRAHQYEQYIKEGKK